MGVKICLLEFFKCFDLFATTSFLRYKQDDSYSTASGGIVSLVVITIFLVLFANTAIQTMNKTIINWSSTTENAFEPTSTHISTSPSDNFMFTLGVMGVNLNDPNLRYFDVQIIDTHVGAGGVILDTNVVDLQPCTREHFSMSQKLVENFESMTAARRLCPPMNYSTNLYGKFTSKEMQYTQLRLSKCNPSLNVSRPCVSDTVIDNLINILGQFTLGMFYVNPLINAGEEEYLDFYFEDRNFVTFTKNMGSYSFARIEDYIIQTDESLLPFTQKRVETGIIIPQLFQIIPYEITNDVYASFYLLKASSKTTYFRSFNKIDELFSYVGGLIGTILGVMLFMNHFTLMSFELDLSKKLMKYKDDEKIDFSGFNLLTYLGYLIYKLGNLCGRFKNWKQMKKKVKCKEEMENQLDIFLFLRRFSFLQRAMEHLLKKDDLKERFYEMENLKQIKKRRKKYKQKGRTQQGTEKKEGSSDSESNEDSSSSESEKKQREISSISENLNESEQKIDFQKNTNQVILNAESFHARETKRTKHRKKSQKSLMQPINSFIKPYEEVNSESIVEKVIVRPQNAEKQVEKLQFGKQIDEFGGEMYFQDLKFQKDNEKL